MAGLTSEQLSLLGDNFLKIAQAIGGYRLQNRVALEPEDNKQLKELHWKMLKAADDLYTTSAKLVLDDVSNSLKKIKNITGRIERSYRKLEDIQKVVGIAGKALALVNAIFSKNIRGINTAFEELEEIIK